MTKREVLTKVMVLDGVDAEMREVLEKMVAQLDKKSSKPTKAQIENERIKDEILEIVADGHARTAKAIGEEVGISTAKASALLRALVLDEKVEKIPGAKSKDAPTYIGKE